MQETQDEKETFLTSRFKPISKRNRLIRLSLLPLLLFVGIIGLALYALK